MQDVSPLGGRLAQVLDDYADLLRQSGRTPTDAEALIGMLALLQDHESLSREVAHLRRALATRAR